MIAINPEMNSKQTQAGPAETKLSEKAELKTNTSLRDIQWTDPKPAANVPKDTKSKLRAKAEKLINSELFSLTPKILSVFGVWFSLTTLMKIGEKGLKDTIKNIIPPLAITSASLLFDYTVKPILNKTIEIPTLTPKVDLEKDLCWDKKDLNSFKRTLKLFMGDRTNYLSDTSKTQELHGTNREGLLILAGPPGNGKTAIAYGVGDLANKPIHSLKVSESSSAMAIESGFKEAHKKGAILFIDEADAIIRSRGDKVTQAFLETFNRYQRENPVRVILATNSYADMDTAIQSRSYVFNLSNPSPELKLDIFKKKLLDQNLKSSAYQELIGKDSNALKELLSKHDLSGRDIESITQDIKVIAEMRINQSIISSSSHGNDPLESLPKDEVRINLEDVKNALEEFISMKQKAKKESISSKKGKKAASNLL